MPRYRNWLVLVALTCALLLFPAPAVAQSGVRCFAETGYCIAGRIRQFWERQGGLPIFGYPITPQQTETIEGKAIQVQWFERNRLELHPENAAPYDVLLGRLGVDQLGIAGRDWQQFTREAASESCLYFAETAHNICGDILTAWRANGLNLDNNSGISADESLALFGLPLSPAQEEQQADGSRITVQWFERARFELHPENTPPYHVLLGLLGREANPQPSANPTPLDEIAQESAAPSRLVISSIGLDQRIVSVGLDAQGQFVVPDHDVGWWNRSAMPGEGENVVMWGHVLRFRNAPQIPAPFARLKELPVGAHITLYDANGASHAYRVTQQLTVTPDQVKYVMPTGYERLTMVSCYGEEVIANGEVVDMSHRLITIAVPE